MTENVFIGRLDGHAEENRTEFSLFVRNSKYEAEHFLTNNKTLIMRSGYCTTKASVQ